MTLNLKLYFSFILNFKDEDNIHVNEPLSVRQAREVVKEFPPDTPDLSREVVQLDIPNKLFGQLAPDVAIRSSELIGSLIQVSIIIYFDAIVQSHLDSFVFFLSLSRLCVQIRIQPAVMRSLCNISSHCWAKHCL